LWGKRFAACSNSVVQKENESENLGDGTSGELAKRKIGEPGVG